MHPFAYIMVYGGVAAAAVWVFYFLLEWWKKFTNNINKPSK